MAKTSVASTLKLEEIRVSGENMRIDTGDIVELSESIKEHGLMQPLVVTRTNKGFLLLCGHRRLAASRRAGLKEVPVMVREVDGDAERLTAMVVENVHRLHLSPLEEGKAFKRMAAAGLSQYEIAERIGKSQTYVSDRLKLTELDPTIQARVHAGELSLTAAIAPHRKKYMPRGERPADTRSTDEKWEVWHLDKVLRWLEAGDLPFDQPDVIARLRLLKKNLQALVIPEICDSCRTVVGYISKCCDEHDDHLCQACYSATHEEEGAA